MKTQISGSIKAHLIRDAFYLVLPVAGAVLVIPLKAPAKCDQRTLTFAEHAGYQRAIEDVCYRHGIWPNDRRDPKPSFDAVISQPRFDLFSKPAGSSA